MNLNPVGGPASPESGTFTRMNTALIRELPDTFDRAIVRDAMCKPDVALARRQHSRYRELLETAGYVVEVVPGDETHPDCVFIEDTAVIVGGVAVAARPGARARRGEVDPVTDRLEDRFEVLRIDSPGTLDGGDVMIMGDTLFIGRSARTNDEGIRQLERVARSQGLTTTPVPVSGVLHLKSAVLPVDEHTVVVTPGTIDESLLSDLRVVHEMTHERHSFSALRMRNGDVLATDNAPDTTEVVSGLGLNMVPIDVSEIQAADGGLTCMSILIDG